jgi:hypothetical protein
MQVVPLERPYSIHGNIGIRRPGRVAFHGGRNYTFEAPPQQNRAECTTSNPQTSNNRHFLEPNCFIFSLFHANVIHIGRTCAS